MFNELISKFKKCKYRGYDDFEIDCYMLKQLQKEEPQLVILDVREKNEYAEKHIPGAINIPLEELEKKIKYLIPNHGQTIVVYCLMGERSVKAIKFLIRNGYTDIYYLGGGISCYKN